MNLFQHIEKVREETSGWCSQEKAIALASIVIGYRPRISLEIGVWYGRSLLPVALAHKHLGYGTVFAVDPWKAGSSSDGQLNPEDRAWWDNQEIHDTAHKSFVESVDKLGLQNVVKIHRVTSNEFDPPAGIGLLSIDGNHGIQSITDIERYAPKVDVGGFLVADDLKWTGLAVSEAVAKLPQMGFDHLYTVQDKESANEWAVYQRVK